MPLPAGKTEANEGNLTIRNLGPADSGLYECVATNSVGTKEATMNLVVQLGWYLYYLRIDTLLLKLYKCMLNVKLNSIWIGGGARRGEGGGLCPSRRLNVSKCEQTL